MGLRISIQKKIFSLKWRKINKHNGTYPNNYFKMDNVKVGQGSYGVLNVLMHNDNYKLTIGNFCSIAPNVIFIVSSEHNMSTLSTFPFKVKYLDYECEAISKGNIVVDDDAWIGCGSIILSGVHIGQGAIIAAGSVVTKDVPPYAIVGGVPAKIIKYRFKDDIIKELLRIDYSKLNNEKIQKNIELLYKDITSVEQVNQLRKVINEE